MRILLTNDDGINAPGIRRAAQALYPFSELIVCAPDREKSGASSAISLQAPILADLVSGFPDGITAYSIQGTPADCVILGLERLVQGKIDLLVSGINAGANLGDDVFVSGTVGAALQGYFRGIPSIAISVTALSEVNFEAAAKLLSNLITENHGLFRSPPSYTQNSDKTSGSQDRPLLLNINVPSIPPEKITGVEITHLGNRSYSDDIHEGKVGRWNWYWISRTKPQPESAPGTDIACIRAQRISITPLRSDLTDISYFSTLEDTKPILSKGIIQENSLK